MSRNWNPRLDRFTTSETVTNKRWTNDKIIYRKVVATGSLPDTTSMNVAHNIIGLDAVVGLSGVIDNGTGGNSTLPRADPGGEVGEIALDLNGANIVIVTGSATFTGYSGTVTVEYTKT